MNRIEFFIACMLFWAAQVCIKYAEQVFIALTRAITGTTYFDTKLNIVGAIPIQIMRRPKLHVDTPLSGFPSAFLSSDECDHSYNLRSRRT